MGVSGPGGILGAMARVIVVMAALLAATAACSKHETPTGTFEARAAAARAPAASPASRGADLPLPPAARMWAGTNSVQAATELYCLRGACSEPGQPLPRMVAAPSRGLLTFAVYRSPLDAHLEIRTARRGKAQAVTALNPGTLMAYGIDLPPRSYFVTLVARWDDSEARWTFRVRVSSSPTSAT
jgi:hypothetical protein